MDLFKFNKKFKKYIWRNINVYDIKRDDWNVGMFIFFLFYFIEKEIKWINLLFKKIYILSIFLNCFMVLELIRLFDFRIVVKMIYNISSK